jgi:hypothetical protein
MTQQEQDHIQEIKELRDKLSSEQMILKKLEAETESKVAQLQKEKNKFEYELRQAQLEVSQYKNSLTFRLNNM